MGSAGVGRRAVLVFGAATVLAACASTATNGDGDKVRTDPEPLERRFTALGPLTDTHWLGDVLGSGSRVPGPTDVRVVGVAQLRAGTVAVITKTPSRGFRPEAPSPVPARLAEFMPQHAGWVRSAAFDDEMTGGTYPGTFYLDPDTDRVYFDTTNPSPATSPATSPAP